MDTNRTSPLLGPTVMVYDHSHIIIPIMVMVFAFPFLVIACLCVIQKRNKFAFQHNNVHRRSTMCQSISGTHGSQSKQTLMTICTELGTIERRNPNDQQRCVSETFVIYNRHIDTNNTGGTGDAVKTVRETKNVRMANLPNSSRNSPEPITTTDQTWSTSTGTT